MGFKCYTEDCTAGLLSAWFHSGWGWFSLSIVVYIMYAAGIPSAFFEIEDQAKGSIPIEVVAVQPFAT